MTMDRLLMLLILVPAAGAVLAVMVRDRAARVVSTLVAAGAAALAVEVIVKTYPAGAKVAMGTLPWLGRKVVLFGLMLDPLSALMLAVITVIGFLVVLYSTEYLGPRNREHAAENGQSRYYFWLLLFLAAMVGVALSPNLLQMFVFWEMTTLCSWALISYWQTERALRAGYKALILTHLGGLAFMVALVVMFVSVKSFDFAALAALRPGLQTAVFVLLLVAALAKSAQLPFYTWLPDAMEAPTPVSAYLHAAAMVKAGVYLMARVAVSNPAVPHAGPVVMLVVSAATISVAVFLYLFQDDLKRLLALSTIAHLGSILMLIAVGLLGSTVAYQGAVLHIACHGVGKALLFLSVGAVAYATGTKSISALGGLGRKMPLTAVAFLVGAFAVTGVPPFAAFWSKFFMLAGALALGGVAGIVAAVVIVLDSLISFGWFLYVAQRVFFGEPALGKAYTSDPPAPMALSLIVLMILSVAAPLLALPLVKLLSL